MREVVDVIGNYGIGERYLSPSGEVMVSTIGHPIAAWVNGLVMREGG